MIEIVEVGPRDGLQNEKAWVPTEAKVAFVNALNRTGTRQIEVTAFVSPKWVPQLKDAREVLAQIERRDGIQYSALVPNVRGFERAMECDVDKLALFTAASETFNAKNINTTIEGSFERMKEVCQAAGEAGKPIRGYISTAFHCPFEGKIEPSMVTDIAMRLLDLGVHDVSIGDTIGRANLDEVERLLDVLLVKVPVEKVAMHFHDTFGQAAGNVVASWKKGVTIFDSCTGGIGGCPYAPGAPGNVSTATVVRALRSAGAELSYDLNAVEEAHIEIRDYLGVPQSA